MFKLIHEVQYNQIIRAQPHGNVNTEFFSVTYASNKSVDDASQYLVRVSTDRSYLIARRATPSSEGTHEPWGRDTSQFHHKTYLYFLFVSFSVAWAGGPKEKDYSLWPPVRVDRFPAARQNWEGLAPTRLFMGEILNWAPRKPRWLKIRTAKDAVVLARFSGEPPMLSGVSSMPPSVIRTLYFWSILWLSLILYLELLLRKGSTGWPSTDGRDVHK